MLDSVGESPDEVEQAWVAEAQRRFAEIERGEVQTLPWAEVRERVFADASAIEAAWTDEARRIYLRFEDFLEHDCAQRICSRRIGFKRSRWDCLHDALSEKRR